MATSSYDRTEIWRLCCQRILGFDDISALEDDEGKAKTNGKNDAPFLNLLPQDFFHNDSERNEIDPWIETSRQLQSNIEEMKSFLKSKESTFATSMSDQEASLVQTTLTSFTAQTAVELEQLHASASSPHRVGINQILMAILKEEIADPFARLSKERSASVSVKLYQNPLQCRVVEPKDDGTLIGTLEDELDRRFSPSRPTHPLHQDLWDSYEAQPRRLKKPTSWVHSLAMKANRKEGFDEDEEDEFNDGTPYISRPTADRPATSLPQLKLNLGTLPRKLLPCNKSP